jgi:predicted glycoside hydrolase/deacetylase ChbG (UPF0249 family)
MSDPPHRRIWLCADDYGLAPGVNAAIRELIARRRLNATSAMVVAPHFHRGEAEALTRAAATTQAAIGLHLTLTAPFRPLTEQFRPRRRGDFLPLGRALPAALLRRYAPPLLHAEIQAQIAAFRDAFGRPPDFVDGHQHVQLFPQVREAVLAAVSAAAPQAWVRQCGRAPHMRRTGDRKGALLDLLSARFRRLAAQRGLRTNSAFAGTYDFRAGLDFAALFPSFINGMPTGGVVMCHPGFPDAELARLDPVTRQRQREYDVLAGAAFPRMLETHGVTLA